jgi:hypothetical protein
MIVMPYGTIAKVIVGNKVRRIYNDKKFIRYLQ